LEKKYYDSLHKTKILNKGKRYPSLSNFIKSIEQDIVKLPILVRHNLVEVEDQFRIYKEDCEIQYDFTMDFCLDVTEKTNLHKGGDLVGYLVPRVSD